MTSAPAGINCGDSVKPTSQTGAPVTLTATPDQVILVRGLVRVCTGTGTCQLAMNGRRWVRTDIHDRPSTTPERSPHRQHHRQLHRSHLPLRRQRVNRQRRHDHQLPAGASATPTGKASHSDDRAHLLSGGHLPVDAATGRQPRCSDEKRPKRRDAQQRRPHRHLHVRCIALTCSFDGGGSDRQRRNDHQLVVGLRRRRA